MLWSFSKNELRKILRARLRMAVPHDEESLRRNLLILLQKGNFDGCVGFLAFQSEPILDEVFLGLLGQVFGISKI